jgi:hypothetical protein
MVSTWQGGVVYGGGVISRGVGTNRWDTNIGVWAHICIDSIYPVKDYYWLFPFFFRFSRYTDIFFAFFFYISLIGVHSLLVLSPSLPLFSFPFLLLPIITFLLYNSLRLQLLYYHLLFFSLSLRPRRVYYRLHRPEGYRQHECVCGYGGLMTLDEGIVRESVDHWMMMDCYSYRI